MGDLKGSFAPRYEAIIFATKGRYELPGKRPDDLIACAKVGNQSLTHPNEKPVALLEQLIEATTIPGALILINAESQADVERILNEDPFYVAEVIQARLIREWNPVIRAF